MEESPPEQLCRLEESALSYSGLSSWVQLGQDLLQPLGLLQILHLSNWTKIIVSPAGWNYELTEFLRTQKMAGQEAHTYLLVNRDKKFFDHGKSLHQARNFFLVA